MPISSNNNYMKNCNICFELHIIGLINIRAPCPIEIESICEMWFSDIKWNYTNSCSYKVQMQYLNCANFFAKRIVWKMVKAIFDMLHHCKHQRNWINLCNVIFVHKKRFSYKVQMPCFFFKQILSWKIIKSIFEIQCIDAIESIFKMWFWYVLKKIFTF